MGIKKTINLPEIQHLADVLDEALHLFDSSHSDGALISSAGEIQPSLIEQCVELCQQAAMREIEPIRTIHHLSCTGGTLITKCLAAMPNVLVLNEIDPLSTMTFKPEKPAFTPTDMLALVRQGDQKVSQDLLVQLFLQNLCLLHNEVASIGRRILVRDHSHSHFLTGNEVPERPSLLSMVKSYFPAVSIVTVRDPVDSFLSLQSHGWKHFNPYTFEEYCRRYHLFLDSYESVPIFRYEDFVRSPSDIVMQMCNCLRLSFTDSFSDTFDTFKFSGDSGRKGNIIEPRSRRELRDDFINNIGDSEFYASLIMRLGYKHFSQI